MVGALEGFADVWGINYIVMAYGIDKSSAAEVISFIPIGMIFGGPDQTYCVFLEMNTSMVLINNVCKPTQQE